MTLGLHDAHKQLYEQHYICYLINMYVPVNTLLKILLSAYYLFSL